MGGLLTAAPIGVVLSHLLCYSQILPAFHSTARRIDVHHL
jgi:hypothetical protein